MDTGFGAKGEPLPAMPLKVIVLAEFTPRDLRSGKSAEHRKRIRVDRQSFDEVMARFSIRVSLDVPDRLSGGDKPLIVDLELKDLKAFRPESIASQVPATRDLVKLRGALADLRSAKLRISDVKTLLGGLATRSAVVESVRRALEAPSRDAAPSSGPPRSGPSSSAAGGAGLDALLSMVEAPGSESEASRGADLSRLDMLVRHLVAQEDRSERMDVRAVDAAVKEIDVALSAQIDEILHHREFRRLESVWRSLRFLTDRTDFQQPIQIEILATGAETLLSVYDEVVHVAESQGVSSEPVSFIVVDQAFSRSPEDLETLKGLCERGAHLSVPVLASASTAFLGLSRASDVAKKAGVKGAFTGPENAKWQGLREYGASRWLGLIFNRFLLRPAYTADAGAARPFQYTERVPASADDLRLWGNPVWALAALATRSHGRIGWCTDIMGQRSSGMIEDLAVRLHDRPGAEPVSFPLETVINDDVERDLTNNGLMALTAALNSDRAYLRFAPTVHVAQHYQDPTDRARAKLQSTLPFQMFVGRLINYAMLVEGILVPGRGPEQISAGYDRALRGLIATAGAVPQDAVAAEVIPNADDPSRQDLHLKVRWPGFQSLPGAGEVELRWPLSM